MDNYHPVYIKTVFSIARSSLLIKVELILNNKRLCLSRERDLGAEILQVLLEPNYTAR